jgi:nucleotide-binding universal stress UspA family protein
LETHAGREFKRLLVAVDGSENAARAARVAVALAKKFGAELIACNIIPTPTYSSAQAGVLGAGELLHDYLESARKEAKKAVDETVRLAEMEDVKATGVIRDNVFSVVEAIVNTAEDRNVDLIVIGTRGLTGFRRLLIGSVSSGVVSHAHCSVLLVR